MPYLGAVNSRFCLWASFLIISLVGLGLCIRALALNGMPVAESLVLRGLSCLAFVIFFAYRRQLSLIPKVLKTQILRAVLAGLALTLLTLSYNWLSASSVSVLSNVDVPLLVVLGPVIGVQATKRARLLSLASIAFLVWYVANLESQVNLAYGLGTLLSGTLLLCFGYLFIKKSMTEENQAVAILTPAVAIVLYGLIESAGHVAAALTPANLALSALSGACMFLAYIATMKLYDLTDIAIAEFPTLISSIVIQPVETLFLNEPMQAAYLLPSLGFVMMTFFIMNLQKPVLSHAT